MLTLGGNVAAIPAKAESTAGTSATDETRYGYAAISDDAQHAERRHDEHEAGQPCPRRHG